MYGKALLSLLQGYTKYQEIFQLTKNMVWFPNLGEQQYLFQQISQKGQQEDLLRSM